MANKRVLVIGGGIAGPPIALFLKRAGFYPVIFEAYDRRTNIGGGLQIAPNGMRVLAKLGISGKLLDAGVESAEFCFENQIGKNLGCIPNGPAFRYKVPAVQISRSVLHEMLLELLERQGIPIHYSKALQDIDESVDQVTASFSDGSKAEGELLIGADGIHSRTRRIIFPQAPLPAYTGLFTVGGFAEHEALTPVDQKGLQRTHLIFGQNGFFGYGHYDRRNPSSVMWWSHLQTANKSAEAERSEDSVREDTISHHREWADPVGLILRNTTRLLSGPIYDLPDLPAWSQNRVVLIGDAAHAISPHAGQGVSLALEDAICLAKYLRSNSHTDAFSKYQLERQKRVQTIVADARKRGVNKHRLSPNAAKMRDLILTLYLKLRGKHLFDEAYEYFAE